MWKIFFHPLSCFRLDQWWLIGPLLLSLVIGWVVFDPIFLRFLPKDTQGLKIVATVTNTQGVVFRKMNQEPLAVPLIEGDRLYAGDWLTTGLNDRAEVLFASGAKLIVPPSSALRIMQVEGKPWLHLRQGFFAVTLDEDSVLYLKSGLQSRRARLYRGMNLIRLTAQGVEWELATGNVITEPLLILLQNYLWQKFETQQTLAIIDSAEQWAQKGKWREPDSISTDQLRLGSSAVPTTFPQPDHKVVFLLTKEEKVRLAARPYCLDQCQLKVKRNRRLIVENSFLRGQVPVQELTLDPELVASYEWSFTDKNYSENFEFQVLPFSEDNLQRSLKEGLNVEVR